jgi:hypothetical protein
MRRDSIETSVYFIEKSVIVNEEFPILKRLWLRWFIILFQLLGCISISSVNTSDFSFIYDTNEVYLSLNDNIYLFAKVVKLAYLLISISAIILSSAAFLFYIFNLHETYKHIPADSIVCITLIS